MFLGMGPFTLFHVAISLVGVVAGGLLVAGLLSAKRSDLWTSVFLWSMVLTTVTGFLFPFERFTPAHAFGILTSAGLALAFAARYRVQRDRGWGRVFAFSSLAVLYFNVFVLIVQLFSKVPALRALAPTQSEPSFVVAQSTCLLLFVALGIGIGIANRSRSHLATAA